ncbi:MAG: hypothetical protein MJ150_01825, partial [Clostridia bacterium]|nr:hypothetical protein [Clostridia bacterium]
VYNGVELDSECGRWTQAEIDHLIADTGDMYQIDPKTYEELETMKDRIDAAFRNSRSSDYLAELTWDKPKMQRFLKSGVTMPVWKDRNSGASNGVGQTGIGVGPGFTLACVEFDRIINEGARALIKEAEQCLEEEVCLTYKDWEKHEYWIGVIKVFEGFINYANRHADLAEEMAKTCEDPKRKAELLRMAETCRRVPEFPARNFYEAVQAYWFTLLSVSTNTMSGGRPDMLLYPYYKKDKEAGILTDEEALELIENIRIKTTTFHTVRGGLARGRHSGDSRWINMVIGGCDPITGKDASNELTMMFMDAAIECHVPHHTITLRVGKDTPVEVIKKGVECISTGVGMPAFISEESYINFFQNKGFAPEIARNFAICGCLDAVIPGYSRTIGVIFYNEPQVLDIFLHNGYCQLSGDQLGIDVGKVEDFATWDEFIAAFWKQMEHFTKLAAERCSNDCLAKAMAASEPFKSPLMHDGIKCGAALDRRRFEPFDTAIAIMTVGGVNTANSLTAIRKLCFDDKKYTVAELIKALDANWEGYDEMRKDFINAPKYGNDDDYADQMVVDFYAQHHAQVAKCDSGFGNSCVPSGISISAHQPCGKVVAATPDGRKAFEILADGMISPQQGTDTEGVLAALNSARKIEQDTYQATLFNMKFSPSALKTDEDKMKLATVLKTYLTNGGKQIQMSVVDAATLKAAQDDPTHHKDVIVRVAGYSAYFVTLTNMMQNEIMTRTEQQTV